MVWCWNSKIRRTFKNTCAAYYGIHCLQLIPNARDYCVKFYQITWKYTDKRLLSTQKVTSNGIFWSKIFILLRVYGWKLRGCRFCRGLIIVTDDKSAFVPCTDGVCTWHRYGLYIEKSATSLGANCICRCNQGKRCKRGSENKWGKDGVARLFSLPLQRVTGGLSIMAGRQRTVIQSHYRHKRFWRHLKN